MRRIKLLAAMLMLLCAAPAWPHARMVRSDPAARAVLSRAPASVQLHFNEKVEPAYSTVELRDARDKVVSQVKAAVSSDDAKKMVLPLPALPDGVYTVVFRVLSVDGHVVKSSFTFTLRSAAR